ADGQFDGGVRMSFQDTDVLLRRAGRYVQDFPAVPSTDVGRGNALLAAVAACQDGDLLYCAPGRFDLASSELDLGLGSRTSATPLGVSLIGSGIGRTIIDGVADGNGASFPCVVRIGNKSEIA